MTKEKDNDAMDLCSLQVEERAHAGQMRELQRIPCEKPRGTFCVVHWKDC